MASESVALPDHDTARFAYAELHNLRVHEDVDQILDVGSEFSGTLREIHPGCEPKEETIEVFEGIVGASPVLLEVFDLVRQLRPRIRLF